jgi:RecA/RadA recombinase
MAAKITKKPKAKAEINISDLLEESIMTMKAKVPKKKNVPVLDIDSFSTNIEDSESEGLNLEPFTLQYAFGTKQVKPGTVLEIIGPEQVGKTTLVFNLLGMFMRSNPYIVSLYIETEGKNKLPDADRIKSCLSSDREEADKLFKQISIKSGRSLVDVLDSIKLWAKTTKPILTEAGVPESRPMIVVVDTLSKCMPPVEAAGMGYGDKTKATGLDEGSNFGFSYIMQKWSRSCTDLVEKYNIFLIFVSHQNVKIDMMTGIKTSAADNKTRIGGQALHQSATYQCTLTRIGGITDPVSGEAISHYIKLKMLKNSRNSDKRTCLYELRTGHLEDTPEARERSINFDHGIPEILAEHRMGVVAKTKDHFNWTNKGLKEVHRSAIAEAFNEDEKLKNDICSSLRIKGYVLPTYDISNTNGDTQATSPDSNEIDEESATNSEDEIEY